MATSLNLFDPQGSSPAGERAAIPGAARPADARPPAANPAEPGPPEARSAARVPAVARSASTAPLDRFAVLLGRAPTDAEKLELVRVKEALDLDNNDALWLLIMGLDHLRGRFERSVEGQRRAFEQSVDRRLEETRHATDALIESAKTRFLEQFPAALKAAARKVSIRARAGHEPAMVAGLLAGLALLVAGAGGASWLAYALGERSGYERGERAGFDKGVLTARADTAPAPKPPAPTVRGR
ncbi:MAG: hypothetical protein V9G18_00330 [Albidovulum sp.]